MQHNYIRKVDYGRELSLDICMSLLVYSLLALMNAHVA